MGLTDQQAHCVDRVVNTNHHLAVCARAGTGKSFTIRKMVEALPRRQRSLILSFNKQNADETRPTVPKWVDVLTTHSLGFRALKNGRNNPALALDSARVRVITGEVVPAGLMRGVYGAVAKLTSHAMNHLARDEESILKLMDRYGVATLEGIPREDYAVWTRRVLARIEEPGNTISFDEMIYLPYVEKLKAGYYDHVFYDEMQDGNAAQRELVLTAFKTGGRLVCVYDDRQCIYQFRGADVREVRRLVVDTLHAEILPLTQTFRCPRKVVDIARGIVADYEACDEAPDGKVTWVDEEESYDLIQPGHVVIARSNYALTRMCLRLLKKGKRAAIVGREYLDKFTNVLDAFPGGTINSFYAWLLPWRVKESARLEATGHEDRAEELGEIVEALKELGEGQGSVEGLRKKLDQLFTNDESSGGRVLLSSVHRAKGLQWPDVWVMESTFRMNNEEGENLYYVAITRTLWTREYAGHLRLIQTPNKKGEYPPSIAREILDGRYEAIGSEGEFTDGAETQG